MRKAIESVADLRRHLGWDAAFIVAVVLGLWGFARAVVTPMRVPAVATEPPEQADDLRRRPWGVIGKWGWIAAAWPLVADVAEDVLLLRTPLVRRVITDLRLLRTLIIEQPTELWPQLRREEPNGSSHGPGALGSSTSAYSRTSSPKRTTATSSRVRVISVGSSAKGLSAAVAEGRDRAPSPVSQPTPTCYPGGRRVTSGVVGTVRRGPQQPVLQPDARRDRRRTRQVGGPGRPALAHPATSSSSRSPSVPTAWRRTSPSSTSP